MTDQSLFEGPLTRDPATLWRRLLDGVLLLPPGADGLLRISEPGSAVWDLLAEPMTPSELAEELGEIFGAPFAVVRADLDPVLRALADARAIKPMTGAE